MIQAKPCADRLTWRDIALITLVAAPLLALAQVRAHWQFQPVDDQKMFSYYGWSIAHGAVEYVDVWDNKPPGIYWINALGFIVAGGYAGVVVLCVVGVCLGLAAYRSICHALYGRAAATFATALAACFFLHPFYDGGNDRTETFVVIFELCAVALYLRGLRFSRLWTFFAAGVCCGLAFLFKQVGLAAWGAMGLHLIGLTLFRRLGWRQSLARGLLLLAGAVTVVSAAAGVLAFRGALYEGWGAVVTFNRAYFSVGDSSATGTYVNRRIVCDNLLLHLWLPAALSVIGFVVAATRRIRGRRPADGAIPLPWLLLGVWFFVALYGAAVSPHHFRHYLAPTIPPLMVMAASVAGWACAGRTLAETCRQSPLRCVALVAMAFAALPEFSYLWRETAEVWRHRAPRWNVAQGTLSMAPTPSQEVGALLASVTGPADRIQGWGFWPGAYLAAERRSASRFTTTEKMGQVGAEANWIRDELWRTVTAKPPAAVFFTQKELELLRQNPSESDWLEQNYDLVGVSNDMTVFRRRGAATQTDE